MPRRPKAPEETPRRRPRPAPPPLSAHAVRRPKVALDEELPQARGGIGGLLGGTGSVLGGLSGINGASRSLDRLSRAAERGADFLERAEAQVGLERLADLADRMGTLVDLLEGRGVLADRLRHMVHAVQGIHDSLQEIEAMVADLHEHLLDPRPQRRAPAARARR
jgi:hypothetical protein